MALDHEIPPVPHWIKGLRCAQLLVTVVFLSIWTAIYVFTGSFAWHDFNLAGSETFVNVACIYGITTASWTGLFLIYDLVTRSSTKLRVYYLKWLAILCEAFTVLLWFTCLVIVAFQAGFLEYNVANNLSYYYSSNMNTVRSVRWYGMVTSASFFAAGNWAMFLLSLVHNSIGLHRYRKTRQQARNDEEIPPGPAGIAVERKGELAGEGLHTTSPISPVGYVNARFAEIASPEGERYQSQLAEVDGNRHRLELDAGQGHRYRSELEAK